jgi:DNA invertase Pin-like site-specific DNA recombinase
VRSTPDRDAAVSAQRTAVRRFLGSGDELVGEFSEDETQNHRRHFDEALRIASRHRATLVIPKFRRIHRTADFLDRLRDAAVDFLALDMPEANRATIDFIAAATARHRRLVSERIRASLHSAKERGRALGNPELGLARPKAVQAARAKAQGIREERKREVVELRKEGRSLRAIADELNRRGAPTAHGREWHASSVRKILAEGGDPTA